MLSKSGGSRRTQCHTHVRMRHPERHLGKMAVVEDAAVVARAAGWVISATHGSTEVHSLVPDVFESYARIFHPAMREATDRDLPCRAPGESRTGVPVHPRMNGVPWREVSWREVAEANGKVAHPAMEWTAITGSYEFSWSGMQPGLWAQSPAHDSLPLRLTRVMCEMLTSFTSTPGQCWAAVWEGYADLGGLRFDERLPRLAMRNRPMILASGPLSAVPEKSFTDLSANASHDREDWRAVECYRSPSLWWPADRAWCVATDVDMQTTYLGGSTECIDSLIRDGRLEVMRVTDEQKITFDADTINPAPSGDRQRA